MCSTLAELKGFRAHASYTNFVKHWNLSVYFQLRFTEIAGKVEKALTLPLKDQLTPDILASLPSVMQQAHFVLNTTRVVMGELVRVWSPTVYIYELTPRFVKLTFQLLARYSSWVASSYDKSVEDTAQVWTGLAPEDYVYVYYDVNALATNVCFFAKIAH